MVSQDKKSEGTLNMNTSTRFVVSSTSQKTSDVPQRFEGQVTATWKGTVRSFGFIAEFHVPLSNRDRPDTFRVRLPAVNYTLTLTAQGAETAPTEATAFVLMNVIGPLCLGIVKRDELIHTNSADDRCDEEHGCGTSQFPLYTRSIGVTSGVAKFMFQDLGFAKIIQEEAASGN